MKTTSIIIVAFFMFLALCVYTSEQESEKEKQFKINMANAGLEQCINPYSRCNLGQEVSWVKTCPEHLK